ncbi:hypothetical protein [Paenibacillus peoriae]|uniref:hypothetical protein n=1 Tax=Paenibacillus peoriae TaxID=59893 RepID=UPI001428BD11|nr:hypothetical protein [Paenibacillus peoriae]
MTNKNVITINPAVPSLGKYGLSDRNYTARVTNYVVKDEILNKTLGEVGTGTTVYYLRSIKLSGGTLKHIRLGKWSETIKWTQ